jgi:dynein heavy chain
MAKNLKSPTIADNAGCLAIATRVKQEIEDFRPLIPLITSLRNPGVRDRHWNMLSSSLGFELRPDQDLTFTLHKAVHELQLVNHLEVISKIGEMAGKEYQIECSLDAMLGAWKEIYFDVAPYRETGTFIIRKTDVIMALLDEHRVLTQAMNFSQFKGPFEARISQFDKQLGLMSEILEEWGNAQRQWMYLQPIFDSPDINKQLPTESAKFKNVNTRFTHRNSGVNGFAN